MNYGAGLEYAVYDNRTYNLVFLEGEPGTIDYVSELDLFHWSAFGQLSKDFLKQRLNLSLGIRMDANNYSREMNNPLDQFSPRLSVSYVLSPGWSLNFNTGRYYQQPAYTTLGYRNNRGDLVNRENDLKYISADHIVAGVEFLPNESSKLSLEGFHKWYYDYPVSVRDAISIASKGGDFGTFGDEEVFSLARGRAYGAEVLYRTRDLAGFNLILSYTLVRSESEEIGPGLEALGTYQPSAWDNRHLLNLTTYRKFKGNWQAGLKYRFAGGTPFTPWDIEYSQQRPAWDVRGSGYLDYSSFNTLRLKGFHQLDLRFDKEWFFNRWRLNLYFDVQNVFNYKADSPPGLYLVEDMDGNPLVLNPEDPYNDQRYNLKEIKTETGTVLPTLGIIIEF